MLPVVLEVGLAQFVHDNPVDGDHVYVAAPVAVSAVEPPVQIATPVPALTVGNALTETVTEAVLVHPFEFVPVTV